MLANSTALTQTAGGVTRRASEPTARATLGSYLLPRDARSSAHEPRIESDRALGRASRRAPVNCQVNMPLRTRGTSRKVGLSAQAIADRGCPNPPASTFGDITVSRNKGDTSVDYMRGCLLLRPGHGSVCRLSRGSRWTPHPGRDWHCAMCLVPVVGRISYLRRAKRTSKAKSSRWNGTAVSRQCLAHDRGFLQFTSMAGEDRNFLHGSRCTLQNSTRYMTPLNSRQSRPCAY